MSCFCVHPSELSKVRHMEKVVLEVNKAQETNVDVLSLNATFNQAQTYTMRSRRPRKVPKMPVFRQTSHPLNHPLAYPPLFRLVYNPCCSFGDLYQLAS